MNEKMNDYDSGINFVQILIGFGVLIIGTLVYLVDRSPDATYFVSNSGLKISLNNFVPNIFGRIGNILPDFAHVFSFILITAGFVSYSKSKYIIITLCWFVTDFIFELGQKYSTIASNLVPEWFEGIPYLENSKNYFLRGTFDILDLGAIIFGAIGAYVVLLLTRKPKH